MSALPTPAENTADGNHTSAFPEPNPQEAKLFFNMIKNMNNLSDIDWDGVATDSGLKNASVAKASSHFPFFAEAMVLSTNPGRSVMAL